MAKTVHAFSGCKLCGSPSALPVYRLATYTIYACPLCNFHFSDIVDQHPPGDSEQKLSSKDRNYLAMREDEGTPHHLARLRLLDRFSNLTNQTKLLDIGAGIGTFQNLVKENFSSVCHGIEPSRLRREYARDRYSLHLHGESIESSYWQEHYANYFDTICLWDVIEHVNDPALTIGMACKLLKPGGLLALETPDRRSISYRLSECAYRLSRGRCSLYLATHYSSLAYGHKQIFTRANLTRLCHSNGLQFSYLSSSYSKGNRRKGQKIIMLATKK